MSDKLYTGFVGNWGLPDGTMMLCIQSLTTCYTAGEEYKLTSDGLQDKAKESVPSVSSTFKVAAPKVQAAPNSQLGKLYSGATANWGLPDGTMMLCTKSKTIYYKEGQEYQIEAGCLKDINGERINSTSSTFQIAVPKVQVVPNSQLGEQYSGDVKSWNLPIGTWIRCVYSASPEHLKNCSYTVMASGITSSVGEEPVIRTSSRFVVVTPTVVGTTATRGDELKYDGGKVRMDLLPMHVLEQVAKVMTAAIEVKGYGEDSWKQVPDARKRYTAALLRHQVAEAKGELIDSDFGLLHAAHKACDALFLVHFAMIEAGMINENN